MLDFASVTPAPSLSCLSGESSGEQELLVLAELPSAARVIADVHIYEGADKSSGLSAWVLALGDESEAPPPALLDADPDMVDALVERARELGGNAVVVYRCGFGRD